MYGLGFGTYQLEVEVVDPNGNRLARVNYIGNSFAELGQNSIQYGDLDFFNLTPAVPTPETFVNGVDADGFPVGGVASGGSGAGFGAEGDTGEGELSSPGTLQTQAMSLNEGLIFQDGQWFPGR